jgi:hypothetical protein
MTGIEIRYDALRGPPVRRPEVVVPIATSADRTMLQEAPPQILPLWLVALLALFHANKCCCGPQ